MTDQAERIPTLAFAAFAPAAVGVKARPRMAFADAARGVGIILVVVGHILGGLMDAHLTRSHAPATVFYLIYTFHMPLFFVLSGLFFPGRETQPPSRFFSATTVKIAWPYLLWSVVQCTVIGAAGSAVNHPINLNAMSYVAVLWSPPSQFWFLYCLAIVQLLSFLVLKYLDAVALFVLALVITPLGMAFHLPYILQAVCNDAIFFVIGIFLGRESLGQRLDNAPWGPIVALALGLVWLQSGLSMRDAGLSYIGLPDLSAALLGSAAVLLACAWPPIRGNAALAYLGRHSMSIYLMHVMFVAGVRVLLHRFGHFNTVSALFPFQLAAGLCGPVLIYETARRLGWTKALGLA